MLRHVLMALLVSLLVALSGLAGCGDVDANVAAWCAVDRDCECDEAGDCCIIEGGSCYEGQCCEGLVCAASGKCVQE